MLLEETEVIHVGARLQAKLPKSASTRICGPMPCGPKYAASHIYVINLLAIVRITLHVDNPRALRKISSNT